MADEATEKQLIEGCVREERHFQELLYRRFSPKMYAVCMSYAGRGIDAADILQEAFVKIFKNIGEFRFDCPLEAWIRRVVVNTAIDTYRKSIRQLPTVSLDETYDVADDTAFAHPSDQRYFLELIESMPNGYRLVFNLYVIEGLNHREIAELTGISEGTSKSQFARAKKYLQQKLQQELNFKENPGNNAGRSLQMV